MPVTIGLDLAKRISWYAAIDEDNIIIEDSKIPSTRQSLEAIVKKHKPELVLVEAIRITAWAVHALVDFGAPSGLFTPPAYQADDSVERRPIRSMRSNSSDSTEAEY